MFRSVSPLTLKPAFPQPAMADNREHLHPTVQQIKKIRDFRFSIPLTPRHCIIDEIWHFFLSKSYIHIYHIFLGNLILNGYPEDDCYKFRNTASIISQVFSVIFMMAVSMK